MMDACPVGSQSLELLVLVLGRLLVQSLVTDIPPLEELALLTDHLHFASRFSQQSSMLNILCSSVVSREELMSWCWRM
jgi:hypothetical protein